MENVRQIHAWKRTDGAVDVVSRNRELAQLVAYAVKMAERLLDNPLRSLFPQRARAAATIEPSLDSTAIHPCKVLHLTWCWVRVELKPSVPLPSPAFQQISRERITQTERHEIESTVLPPMREIASADQHLTIRLEESILQHGPRVARERNERQRRLLAEELTSGYAAIQR
jgi:hypothetical protein